MKKPDEAEKVAEKPKEKLSEAKAKSSEKCEDQKSDIGEKKASEVSDTAVASEKTTVESENPKTVEDKTVTVKVVEGVEVAGKSCEGVVESEALGKTNDPKPSPMSEVSFSQKGIYTPGYKPPSPKLVEEE